MLLGILGSLETITFIQTKEQTSGGGAKRSSIALSCLFHSLKNVLNINFTSWILQMKKGKK